MLGLSLAATQSQSNESFKYLFALISPDLAWPSKFSARAARPQSLPSSPLSLSDVTSWYVQVFKNLPTHSPPVKRAAPLVGRT